MFADELDICGTRIKWMSSLGGAVIFQLRREILLNVICVIVHNTLFVISILGI